MWLVPRHQGPLDERFQDNWAAAKCRLLACRRTCAPERKWSHALWPEAGKYYVPGRWPQGYSDRGPRLCQGWQRTRVYIRVFSLLPRTGDRAGCFVQFSEWYVVTWLRHCRDDVRHTFVSGTFRAWTTWVSLVVWRSISSWVDWQIQE